MNISRKDCFDGACQTKYTLYYYKSCFTWIMMGFTRYSCTFIHRVRKKKNETNYMNFW